MTVDGIYNTILHSPMGDMIFKLVFKTDGNTLTGYGENSMIGTNQFENGRVNGNQLTWTVNVLNSPVGPMKIEMSATINDNKITGQTLSPFYSAPFDGTKE